MNLKHLLLTLFDALIMTEAIAQSGLGSIRGQIVDEAKQPLKGVTIQLLRTNYFIVSNSEGLFSINGIASGLTPLLKILFRRWY